MSQSLGINSDNPQTNNFAVAVLEGLSAEQKNIPCQFLYDAAGSQLFEDITYSEEYYPTRAEISLLEDYVNEIADLAGNDAMLIEFGSGSSRKTNILLEVMHNLKAYVPIDISDTALHDAKERLKREFPSLKVLPLHADFNQSVNLPEDFSPTYRLGFFPGSTVGNLSKDEAIHFLVRARHILGPKSGFVVGVDLQKDLDVLLPAYDDAQGITANFNLNLLRRINSDLDADFDITKFHHRALYNDVLHRVEMHLESQEDQVVNILGHKIAFKAGETIHTENSYKYTIKGFAELAESAGWATVKTWVDKHDLFSVHYLIPKNSV